MSNFKLIAAVFVVLLAFTGFQVITNTSLRKAVRDDVQQQIQSSEGRMLRHQEQLQKATEKAEELGRQLDAAKAKAADQAAALDELARAVAELHARVESANAELQQLLRSLERVEKDSPE